MDETNRRIVAVYFIGHGGSIFRYRVGHDGVTDITTHTRNGEMAAVPIVRVWRREELWVEMDKGHVIVEYATPAHEERVKHHPFV